MNVRPKKGLGQHFLKDENIAFRIVDSLKAEGLETVLEIGAGMGVLTKYLLTRHEFTTHVVELDSESVNYLQINYPTLSYRIIEKDFLKMDLPQFSNQQPFAIIGNFPYNISNQILFKVFENRDLVPELVGMFQHEVAQRVTSPAGSKAYGILSVFLQAFYKMEYLFIVDETVFNPPPKVKSAVIRMVRNDIKSLGCDEDLFKRVVKTAFNQRRKTLRNSLKCLLEDRKIEHELMELRPERLNVEQFIQLTKLVYPQI